MGQKNYSKTNELEMLHALYKVVKCVKHCMFFTV